MSTTSYDIIIAGTGPAGAFFLHRALSLLPKNARILVLDRGALRDHQWHIDHRSTWRERHRESFVNHNERKDWIFNLSFGGASNCWYGVTPRMLPNDFKVRSLYGVGYDWPLSYEELEPYYAETEAIMAISGSEDGCPAPRSNSFPQPPHRFTDVDRAIKAAFPESFSAQPTARARVAVGRRAACCATSVCHCCPINAKFTILNSLADIYQDPRVTLWTETPVERFEFTGEQVSGVVCTHEGKERTVHGELVACAANGIFNPFLLQRSGLEEPWLGKGLNEQVSLSVRMDLKGLSNVGGSTIGNGIGYMFWDGPHRKERPACMLLTGMGTSIRLERCRWREFVNLSFVFEDIPDQQRFVRPSQENLEIPETVYADFSDYLEAGHKALPELVGKIAEALPVEKIHYPSEWSKTEAHILGTTRMGSDPAESVVDSGQLHHRYRNLVILGSSVFPSCSPANPTLTLSALSLRAADRLFS